MTNLTEIIEQWIGEEMPEIEGYPNPFNEVRRDLKSKIPDLIEQIEKQYELTERF